jgi:hypothetical protein
MLKQRLIGIALIVLGILSVIPERDATAAVMLVPLGLYDLFTKKNVLYK